MHKYTWLDIVSRQKIKEPTIEEQIQRVIDKGKFIRKSAIARAKYVKRKTR